MSEQPSQGGSGTGTPGSHRVDPAEASLGELVRQMSEDTSHLIRSELKLAQAEMSAKAKSVGVGIGGFSVAGLLAFFGIAVLLAAAILGLATVLPGWLAAVIIGVALLVIAGIVAMIARKKVAEATPPMPERTIATVKQDVDEIKERAKR